MTYVCLGILAVLLSFAGLGVWGLIDIHRINRSPDDDYPVSRRSKGEWE
jgi:hypothetical protein